MRYFLLFIFFISSLNSLFSLEFNDQKLKKSLWKKIEKGQNYSKSEVKTQKETQSLDFLSLGLHPKSCQIALVKISRYEYYEQFLDFVKKSTYDDSSKRLYLELEHSLLPFSMNLNFVIDRVSKPGVYPFHFDGGFLKGLKGTIRASQYQDRCFLVAKANWQGPDTSIPDTAFELFTEAMGQLTLRNLFRISKTMTF